MRLHPFFTKLISYGGISINDGILRIWKDPNIFVEKNVYATFHFECYEVLGKDFEDLIYIIGEMIGYINSIILGEFFGISATRIWIDDHTDADDFMNGATQDGWGKCTMVNYPEKDKPIKLYCEIKDEQIPLNVINKYKTAKKVKLHSYVTGIISGGARYLYKKQAVVIEEVCQANDNRNLCKLKAMESKKPVISKLLVKSGINLQDLYKKVDMLYKKREYEFKPFTMFKISYGDGNFQVKNYYGSVMTVLAHAPIHYVIKKSMKREKFVKMQNNTAKVHAEVLKNQNPNIKDYGLTSLKKIFEDVSVFGYGKFDISIYGEKNNIINLTNKNNAFANDYKALFGNQKECVDDYLCALFVNIMKVFFNKESTCEEINCSAKTDDYCVFKITIIN